MDAARPSSPAAALLAVALVWSLLLAARAPGAHGPEADAALLVAVGLACAALLALRPAAPAHRRCAGQKSHRRCAGQKSHRRCAGQKSHRRCAGQQPDRGGARQRSGADQGPHRGGADPRTGPRLAALLAAGAGGFASLPVWLTALAAAGNALGLGPPPAVRAPSLALAAVQVGPGPLLEELLYRERLLGALRPRLGAAGAVAASSAVFAAAHPEPWSALGALGVGAALGALFAATRSLALCAVAHAGFNTAACLWVWGRG